MKIVVIVVSGRPAGQNLLELEVLPGSTAGDVLRTANLAGYLLSREGSAQAFAAEECIYDAIQDGEKIRATPIAEVGAGILESLLRALGLISPPFTVHSVRRPPRVRRKRTAAIVPCSDRRRVCPDGRPLWQLRGWRQDGDTLVGAYRTPRMSFAGEIHLNNSRCADFFVLNPPQAVLEGPHGACFRPRGGGRYFVHFGKGQAEVDSGIVAVESLLARTLTAGT